MRKIVRYYNNKGTICNKKQASNFEEIIYNDDNTIYQVWMGKVLRELEESNDAVKQNKTLDNEIVTPNKLDTEAEDILGSLENDVMKILKKTKYFDKVLEE